MLLLNIIKYIFKTRLSHNLECQIFSVVGLNKKPISFHDTNCIHTVALLLGASSYFLKLYTFSFLIWSLSESSKLNYSHKPGCKFRNTLPERAIVDLFSQACRKSLFILNPTYANTIPFPLTFGYGISYHNNPPWK